MSDDVPILDLRARAYFHDIPALPYAPLAAAWAEEGKECEDLTEGRRDKWALMAMRGPNLVALGLPVEIDRTHVAELEAHAAIDFDFTQTFIVDPRAALADLRASRYEVSVLLRIEEPADRRICFNELACTLLGIDRHAPLSALWLEGPRLAVGRRDLSEQLALQDTRDGNAPLPPTSLMFATNLIEQEGRVHGGTRGLDFFGHAELVVDTARPEDAARLLYNVGSDIVAGAVYAPGHTLSSGPLRARVEATGEPLALRLVSVPST